RLGAESDPPARTTRRWFAEDYLHHRGERDDGRAGGSQRHLSLRDSLSFRQRRSGRRIQARQPAGETRAVQEPRHRPRNNLLNEPDGARSLSAIFSRIKMRTRTAAILLGLTLLSGLAQVVPFLLHPVPDAQAVAAMTPPSNYPPGYTAADHA